MLVVVHTLWHVACTQSDYSTIRKQRASSFWWHLLPGRLEFAATSRPRGRRGQKFWPIL